MDAILTRQERENRVLDLYFNQNKNTREISQEAKISFREIGTILDKARKDKEASKEQTEKQSLSTQAYRLFSEGKTPTQAAIALNIRQLEVTELQNEYWKLNQLYDLDQVYEETKGDFSSLVELYKQMKTAGMNIVHVIRLLSIADNDIRSIEYRCQELRREAASLEYRNRNAARTLEQLSFTVSETQNTLDHYESLRKQGRLDMNELFHRKTQLEEFVENFVSNNTEYIKIKENTKQEIENTLRNPKRLLRLALSTLIESLRKDIGKFQLLYYQMSTGIAAIVPPQSLTASYSVQNYSISNINEKQFQDYNDPTEAFQNFVLDEAEKLYDKLIDDSLNKVGNKAEPLITGRFDIKSSPPSQKIAAFAYRKEEEEHILIESESDNENTT